MVFTLWRGPEFKQGETSTLPGLSPIPCACICAIEPLKNLYRLRGCVAIKIIGPVHIQWKTILISFPIHIYIYICVRVCVSWRSLDCSVKAWWARISRRLSVQGNYYTTLWGTCIINDYISTQWRLDMCWLHIWWFYVARKRPMHIR